MEVVEKISQEAKEDRHKLNNRINDFLFKIDGEFDKIKEGLASVPVILEKVEHNTQDLNKIEKDHKEEINDLKAKYNTIRDLYDKLNWKVWWATWVIWTIVFIAWLVK